MNEMPPPPPGLIMFGFIALAVLGYGVFLAAMKLRRTFPYTIALPNLGALSFFGSRSAQAAPEVPPPLMVAPLPVDDTEEERRRELARPKVIIDLPLPGLPRTEIVAVEPTPAVPAPAPRTLDLTAAVPKIKLSEVLRADNVAIVGPKGTGKTTLLRTMMAKRSDERIILDPHNSPGKWPGAQVVGGGMKFKDIYRALQALDTDMVARAGALDRGEVAEGRFPRRTLASDEFWSICVSLPISGRRSAENYTPGAGDFLLQRLTQGRKFCDCVIAVSHSDTMDAFGLPPGSSEAKKCFDYWVYLGALALQRYESSGKGKVGQIDAVREMERPAVVWHPERDLWYMLDFDLEPVLAASPVATALQPEQQPFTALESAPDECNDVAKPKATAREIALIGKLKGQGLPPSEITKRLPGYDARNYRDCRAKVDEVLKLIEGE